MGAHFASIATAQSNELEIFVVLLLNSSINQIGTSSRII